MKLAKVFLLSVCFISVATAQDKFNFSSDIKAPYNIFKNPTNGFYYVCNVIGAPHIKDNTANISAIWFQDFEKYKLKARVTPPISSDYEGTNLSSPTGLAYLNNHLLITDVDSLAIFKQEENKRPKQVAHYKVKGAQKLEAMVVVDDVIYLADSEANAILKITDFFDKEKREVTRLSKISSPTGMIYDNENDALLIVSSKVNKLFELNLIDIKESKSYTIGPKATSNKGFYDLCMGNQKEIYLVHYSLGKILIYFRDQDRPKTIIKPMAMAKPFINDLRSPTSIIYDKTFNRVIYTQYFRNLVTFQKGLKPQLTLDEIRTKIDIEAP